MDMINTALEELKMEINKLGASEARPWGEFLKDFKQPSNLVERVDTNFEYYKGNYALLLIGFTIFGLCIHPEAFVTVVVSLIAIAVLLILKIETSPGHIVSPEMKLAVSLPVVFVMLLRAGVFFWSLYGLLLGLLFCSAHMVFRTRTAHSRMSSAWTKITGGN
ncbi:hypothetical protein AAMO2058_000030800 [Amorphochlora amoebiformis]